MARRKHYQRNGGGFAAPARLSDERSAKITVEEAPEPEEQPEVIELEATVEEAPDAAPGWLPEFDGETVKEVAAVPPAPEPEHKGPRYFAKHPVMITCAKGGERREPGEALDDIDKQDLEFLLKTDQVRVAW